MSARLSYKLYPSICPPTFASEYRRDGTYKITTLLVAFEALDKWRVMKANAKEESEIDLI
jgi:hypothetical protein